MRNIRASGNVAVYYPHYLCNELIIKMFNPEQQSGQMNANLIISF